MNPMEAVASGFRNYINFSGRAGRSEFWWFFLFTFVSTILVVFIPFIGWLYALAMLLPTLAATVRRLHDLDQSGWWAIVWFLPFVNWLLLIYLAFPGAPGPNRYGPDPLQQQWVWPGQSSTQPPPDQSCQPAPPTVGQNTRLANLSATDVRGFCTQCGMQLQPDARFCTACGTAI